MSKNVDPSRRRRTFEKVFIRLAGRTGHRPEGDAAPQKAGVAPRPKGGVTVNAIDDDARPRSKGRAIIAIDRGWLRTDRESNRQIPAGSRRGDQPEVGGADAALAAGGRSVPGPKAHPDPNPAGPDF